MRRTTLALLLVLSACSGSNGSSTTPTPFNPTPGFTLPGAWTLQTSASDTCSGLSADGSRSYSITVLQTGFDTIEMILLLNGVSTPIMNASSSGLKIQDHLRLVDNSASGKLVIDGTFTGTVTASKIAGTLNGNFTTATADCAASNHTLTFTR